MVKTFIIVHGWDGNPNIGWLRWLKEELQKRGHRVIAQRMPNPGEPKIDEWVSAIFKIAKDSGKNIYFIGHSIGCQAILRFLEKYDFEIGGAIFVAGFFDLMPYTYNETPETAKESRRIAKPWIEQKIRFSQIKIPKDRNWAIFSDNDPYVSVNNAKIFKEKLQSTIIIEKSRGHYIESKCKSIPVILDLIKIIEVGEDKMQSHYVREHFTNNSERGEKMKHELPKLTYKYDALEPYIDAKTMEIHHTKHHQAYVDKLNAAIEPFASLQQLSVEELLKDLVSVPEQARNAVRNHGGGHYNHTMFWTLLRKDTKISKSFSDILSKSFGSIEAFKKQFSDAAMNRFGSGWAWLVVSNGKLEIVSTANQDNPISEGKKPILGIDVWEHAYYLKYQSKRAEYIDNFWNVVNWSQIEKNYNEAIKPVTVSSVKNSLTSRAAPSKNKSTAKRR